ncbi:MAG: NADH dehydrogenase [Tenericutes bacterium ADurb.Bin239]|jgi:nitroreductase/CBS domain-containing protein|nr:MAG: NADH dehydrogenase [Tenericutes bacterium ADurb.Bin239]
MNILMILTPKKEVTFLTTKMSLKEAMDILKKVRFNSVPLLDDKGYYIGTVTEGDILWHLEKNGYEGTLNKKLKDVKRIRDYAPVTVDAEIDELVTKSLGQNFIPILDDRKFFIGIVTRKKLITTFIEQNELEKEEIVHENDVIDNLYKRRSIRKFKEGVSVPREIIDEIVKVSLVTPTAMNRRPHEIVLVDDPEVIKTLSELHQRGGQFEKAPYLILIMNDDEKEPNAYLANSNCSALLMSLLLAVESFENLGGFWVSTRYPEYNRKMLNALGVPERFSLYGMVAFGVKGEHKPANEPLNPEKIHYNKW